MTLEKQPPGRIASAYINAANLIDGVTFDPDIKTTIDNWLALADTFVMGDMFDNDEGIAPEYADISTRKRTSRGFTARKPVIKEGEVTFEMLWSTNVPAAGPDDEKFVQLIIDHSESLTPVAMFFSDYAHNATRATGEIYQGLLGNWYVTFTKQEPIRDVQRASVTAVAESFVGWYKSDPAP